MFASVSALVGGFVLLIWSANRFVDGSSAIARHAGMSPLLVGMVIVGFGTSAPEMTVSAFASWQGASGIALGNAYGSNICNIALILGLTALLKPIVVHSNVVRRELPILTGITFLAIVQLLDYQVSRADAVLLLAVFGAYMLWCIRQSLKQRADVLSGDLAKQLDEHRLPLRKAVAFTVLGLILLIISSRILVWGAIGVAKALGVSDLIIGLTIVAVGTSLPELASSLAAIRKNEHDIALGNIIGSNLFNTLVVVGIAGSIRPMTAAAEVLSRDLVVMGVLTVSLFATGCGFRNLGRISRLEGALLLLSYAGYLTWLVISEVN